jgi:hypothetical protein
MPGLHHAARAASSHRLGLRLARAAREPPQTTVSQPGASGFSTSAAKSIIARTPGSSPRREVDQLAAGLG